MSHVRRPASRTTNHRPSVGRGMRVRPLVGWLLTIAAVAAGAAEVPAERRADAEAIRAAAATYRDALVRGDAAALAALWMPGGDIVDDAGNVLPGRETASLVSGEAAGPRPEFEIVETNLRFLTADTALEDGTVEVRLPGGGTLAGHFAAVWVRHDGAWKLTAIREARSPEADGAGVLQRLEWMVGEWDAVPPDDLPQGPPPGKPISMSVRWNPTRTFLVREMLIPPPPGVPADVPPLEITQQIGWDPLARQVRGWAFGSDGSHGESTWILDDGSWVSRTVSVRPDGQKTSSLVVYTPDGPERCIVHSLPTHIGGEHDPHLVLTLARRPPAAARPDGAP
jgi:uncharacterized protein (TIGR02246 family)